MEISQADQRWLENQSMSLIDASCDMGTAMETKELNRPIRTLTRILARLEKIKAKAEK